MSYASSLPGGLLIASVLANAVLLGCSREPEKHFGRYETRVAFVAFTSNDIADKSDCARPSGIARADSSLVVGAQDDGDYIEFQSCRIGGEIEGGRFLAEGAPCAALGGFGEPKYPHRVYDQVEVDFEAGTIQLMSSDLGPESVGQCNQLDGYLRLPSAPWRPSGTSFWVAEAPWNIVSERFRGVGEISTYVQRQPNGSQHVLGLSCLFPSSSGGGPNAETVKCETPFQGRHGVPKFVPGEFEVSEDGISLRGEFQSTDRTYQFTFETTSIERAP